MGARAVDAEPSHLTQVAGLWRASRSHSVVVIEHDQGVVAEDDWVIDLKPEGGSVGRKVVLAGTLEQVVTTGSHTGVAVRAVLGR